MIKITDNKETYYKLFDDFKYFHTFLVYAINDLEPDIYVDDMDNPNCAVIATPPAFIIKGEPHENYIDDVLEMFYDNSHIIAESKDWYNYFDRKFAEGAIKNKRVLFDSNSLVLDEVLKLRVELPKGVRIEKIDSNHLETEIIKNDVINRFFTKSKFIDSGFGFALMDNEDVCHGFALSNFPIYGRDIELYFRIGYDDNHIYRKKGIGTTLCTYLIEYCLNKDYFPIWDAANEVSAHIAKKIGYKVLDEWVMYNIRTKQEQKSKIN